MNYDRARQLADGSWAWTTMNDGVLRYAGECGPEATHATQEEAEWCFWHWQLGRVRLVQLDLATLRTRNRCYVTGCQSWEDYQAVWPGGFLRDSLCEEHATHAGVVALHPFTPGWEGDYRR